VGIACQSYALFVDGKWNSIVNEHGTRICPFLMKQVDTATYKKLVSELEFDKKSHKVLNKKTPDTDSDKRLLGHYIIRDSAAEKAALALIIAVFIILSVHLFTACWSSNYEVRTKWVGFIDLKLEIKINVVCHETSIKLFLQSAVAQGTVIFMSGFSAVFLSM
jgi:hypothetical protein